MPIITPQLNPADSTFAAQMLDKAIRDYQAALSASQYSTGGRQVTRQSLFQLRQEITYWQRVVLRQDAAKQGARDPQTQTAVWEGDRRR